MSVTTAIEYLKKHVAWLKETSRNQLFDAHAIGEMIKEAEERSRRGGEG